MGCSKLLVFFFEDINTDVEDELKIVFYRVFHCENSLILRFSLDASSSFCNQRLSGRKMKGLSEVRNERRPHYGETRFHDGKKRF